MSTWRAFQAELEREPTGGYVRSLFPCCYAGNGSGFTTAISSGASF